MHCADSVRACSPVESTTAAGVLGCIALTLCEPVVQGRAGRLRGRTFSAPKKWIKGKGRVTCQFGASGSRV